MLTPEGLDNPTFIKSPNFYKGRNKPVELIVIHTMEAPEKGDTAEAVARYFQNPGLKASAHYCVDNNSFVQCVWDSNTAWHCKNANANGIGIEHAGYARQDGDEWDDDYSRDMLWISAQITAYLCKKFDIPVQKAVFASATNPAVVEKGICGHNEVPLHGSHWDPGYNFPWAEYLQYVKTILMGYK